MLPKLGSSVLSYVTIGLASDLTDSLEITFASSFHFFNLAEQVV